MKRLITIAFIIMSLFLLAGCNDPAESISASVTFVNLEPGITSVSFDLELSDPEIEVTEYLSVRVYNEDGSLFTTSDLIDLTNLADITIGSLTSGKTYRIDIQTPAERSMVTIGTVTITTLSLETVTITTTEEFLNMGQNRSGNYVLGNDLDFDGVVFNSPFSNAFSGTFDGQGFTIRNVTFEKVSTYTGVFGYIASGTVKNVTLENIEIGSSAAPLVMPTSSRVGIIAGYVSSTMAVIENVTVKDSSIYFSSSSTVQAYVGGAVGELRATLKDTELNNVTVHLEATSYGRINVGGIVGFLTEDGILRQVKSTGSVDFHLTGENIRDREFDIKVGGAIGYHNATTNNKSVENVAVVADVDVSLDFGTTLSTGDKDYNIYVGGFAGIAYSNVINALYDGSVTLTHEGNVNEADVNKYFFVGGLFGSYVSSRALSQVVRIGESNTMTIDVSDDYQKLETGLIFGQLISSATHVTGIYGTRHLMVNDVSEAEADPATTIVDIDTYLTSEWLETTYRAIYGEQ